MAKPTEQRISRLQTPEIQSTPQREQVTAHPVDTTVAPAPDWELQGLVQGLSEFNPKLERYTQTRDMNAAQDAVDQGKLDGRLNIDPNKNLTNPATFPEKILPAFQPQYAAGYRDSVGLTLGGQSRDAMVDEYNKNKNKPDFNLEGFIKDFTAKEFTGVTDPHVLGNMSKIHASTIASLRDDFRKTKLSEFMDSTRTNLAGGMDTLLTPNMSAADLTTAYRTEWLPAALKSGAYTRPEAAKQFVDHVTSLSNKLGGSPELFDAFRQKDDSGISIENTSPQMRAHIDAARAAAKTMRDTRMKEEALLGNAVTLGSIHDMIRENPEALTDAMLLKHVGKFGPITSDTEYAALRDKRDKAIAARGNLTVALNDASNGNLWAHPEKERKAALTQLTASPVQALVDSINTPSADSQAKRAAAADAIIRITDKAGVAAPNERLQELFSSIGKQIPAKDAVAPERFNMAADVYATLKSKAPHLLGQYYDDDARTVMEGYLSARNSRVEPKLAYQQAYASITPEAKALAKEREMDPAFKQQVKSQIEHAVPAGWRDFIGLSGIGKMLGFYPTNEETVVSAAKLEVQRLMLRDPNLSTSDALKRGEQWAKDNFIHDTHSNLLVRVPPGQANEATAEAITAYTKETSKTLGKDAHVEMVFNGRDGFTVMSRNPDAALEGDVSLASIMQKHYYTKHFNPEEQLQMTEFKKQLNAGSLTGDDINKNAALIAKAKLLGVWNNADSARAQRIQQGGAKGGTKVSAMFGDAAPAFDNLDASALPANATKTDIASRFLQSGDVAGALTTMGEGVALKRYKDAAGVDTIGIGYNLQANAANIAEDFRRAGIPADMVNAVKGGYGEISTEQAMRLFKAVQPRYAAIAKDGVEKRYPGEWDKLPDNQKAVLTDMAYQVGSIDKFTNMMNHLIGGNLEMAGEGMKVHYQSRSGEKVVDLGRHNLRMIMLHNPDNFDKALKNVARKPRSIIDARVAINQ